MLYLYFVLIFCLNHVVVSASEPIETCNLRILLVDIGWGRLGNILMQFAPAFALRHQYDLILLRGMVGSVWNERKEQLEKGKVVKADLGTWIKCFPNIASYVFGEPVVTVTDVKSRLMGSTSSGLVADCALLGQLLNSSSDINSLANHLFESVGRGNWTTLTEVHVAAAIAKRPSGSPVKEATAFVDERLASVNSTLPPFAMTLHHGSGSWWQNYDWFVGPQLSELRNKAFAIHCCDEALDANPNHSRRLGSVKAVVDSGKFLSEAHQNAVSWSDPRTQYVVHFRDFRHETGRNLDQLLKRPTLRPQYIVELLRDELGARNVLVLTEKRFSQSRDADVIRSAWPTSQAEVVSGAQHADFCVMVLSKATLFVSPGSTFSYWAAVLGHSGRVVVPRLLGIHAIGEVDDGGSSLRRPWPVNTTSWSNGHTVDRNHFVPFEYITVPHWAIDTRDIRHDEEQSWDDYTFENGTKRPRPLHLQPRPVRLQQE